MPQKTHLSFQLTPEDNARLANLSGQFDEHLKQIEIQFGVEIVNRGHHFQVYGKKTAVTKTKEILLHLYQETQHTLLTPHKIHLFVTPIKNKIHPIPSTSNGIQIITPRLTIKPHSKNQSDYLQNIEQCDINFGIGLAGTGKTYLAVACAIAALTSERISRLLLVRPAVEAGEKLGFLPGDFTQKLDPYFRPLYDALYDMIGFDEVNRLIAKHIIEVVPLAYMRGRTLNDAFIILDEAQNTTKEQMKMFLTRIGFNSKTVITGDLTQTDLPKSTESGLKHCLQIIKPIQGISVTHFDAGDVVRHPLVQDILHAYETHEKKSSPPTDRN